MSTSYYIVKKRPTIRETVRICTRSWGWETGWHATDDGDWINFYEDPTKDENGRFVSEHTLPHAINSVDDIRAYLETGEWLLVDEYGTIYGEEPHEEDGRTFNDWRTEIDELESWDGGRAGWNARNPDNPVTWEPQRHTGGFHDRKGNHFSREEVC